MSYDLLSKKCPFFGYWYLFEDFSTNITFIADQNVVPILGGQKLNLTILVFLKKKIKNLYAFLDLYFTKTEYFKKDKKSYTKLKISLEYFIYKNILFIKIFLFDINKIISINN